MCSEHQFPQVHYQSEIRCITKLKDKLGKKRILFLSHWSARKIKIGSSHLSIPSPEFWQWEEENMVVRTVRCSQHGACVARYLL